MEKFFPKSQTGLVRQDEQGNTPNESVSQGKWPRLEGTFESLRMPLSCLCMGQEAHWVRAHWRKDYKFLWLVGGVRVPSNRVSVHLLWRLYCDVKELTSDCTDPREEENKDVQCYCFCISERRLLPKGPSGRVHVCAWSCVCVTMCMCPYNKHTCLSLSLLPLVPFLFPIVLLLSWPFFL
jgi:hypothetical protein